MFNFIKKFFISKNIKNSKTSDENKVYEDSLEITNKNTDNSHKFSKNITNNFNIPDHIKSLLWFKNGPLKNFFYTNKDNYSFKFKYEGLEVTISYNLSSEEPSLISLSYPINISSLTNPLDEIGYFPSYKSLNSKERGIYLKWLKNPLENKDICIGYVFIFYYGLERFLFLENRIDAFDMILQLRKIYTNNSFQHYSLSSLLSYAFATKSEDLITKIMTTFPEEISSYTNFKIWNKYPLNSQEIIFLASKVGFTNKRYIKLEYNIFKKQLENLLFLKSNTYLFNLNTYDSTNIKLKNIIFTANYSLRELKFEVPDLLENISLKTDLYNILVETHNNTKLFLKEKRRKNKKTDI